MEEKQRLLFFTGVVSFAHQQKKGKTLLTQTATERAAKVQVPEPKQVDTHADQAKTNAGHD